MVRTKILKLHRKSLSTGSEFEVYARKMHYWPMALKMITVLITLHGIGSSGRDVFEPRSETASEHFACQESSRSKMFYFIVFRRETIPSNRNVLVSLQLTKGIRLTSGRHLHRVLVLKLRKTGFFFLLLGRFHITTCNNKSCMMFFFSYISKMMR